MAKTLNKDQIALLDKEVAKLDKKLSNKDMEKAMGMLMKKVGIQESDLDELSMNMKSMTKSGINKNVGVDKDKLKMSLKDLRKKLDKKKDEANIVRSKKSVAALRRKSAEENPKIRKEEQVDEAGPGAALLGLGALAYKGYKIGKPVIDPLIKKGIDKAAPAISRAGQAIKNRLKPSTSGTVPKPPTQSTRGFKPQNIAKPRPKISNTPSRPGDRGFKPQNTPRPKNTKPPQQKGNLGNRMFGGPEKPGDKKKGLSTLAKVGLGVGAAVAGKKTYDAMRNRAKEREAEMKRKSDEYQQRRQNNA